MKKLFSTIFTNIILPIILSAKKQSGFLPGDSTTNQLIDLVNDIHHAFDSINHLKFVQYSKICRRLLIKCGLIFKMRQNGVTGRLLKLFRNYLNNRKQRVVLTGFPGDYSSIESGVPKGSVLGPLGPLLFLIYINDLERNIKSNVNCFADDTMLFSTVNDPVISANELNQDLKVINQWAYQWKIEFNPDPNKQATELFEMELECITII